MKKIKIGIIGLGVGMHHYQSLKKIKKCEIIAICDLNIKNLEKIKDKNILKTTNEDIFFKNKDLQAVVIASFDSYHFNHVLRSLKNNLHIFVEKPLCLNNFQLNKIKKIASEKNKLAIYSNFNLRFNQIYIALKSKITEKKFGQLYYIEASYNYSRLYKITNGWRGKQKNYSINLGGGIHLIDLIFFLTSLSYKKSIGLSNNISTKKSKFKSKDFSVSLIEFKNSEVILKLSVNFGSNGPHNHGLKIFGTKRTYILDYPDIKIFTGDDRFYDYKKIKIKKNNDYKKKPIKYFIEMIGNEKKIASEKNQLFKTMSAIIDIDKSIKK